MRYANQHSYPPKLRWDAPLRTAAVGTLLEESATSFPARTAINFLGKALTYARLQTHVLHLTAALQKRGVAKGDKVAICLPNCPAAVVAYYAILRAGGVVVNTNPLYTKTELANILADSGAKLIITSNLAVSFAKVLPYVGQGALQHMVVVNFAHELPWHLGLGFRLFKRAEIAAVPPRADITWYHEALTEKSPPKPVNLNPVKNLAVIQYTGGTTGIPKGAMLSHAALVANVEQIRLWIGSTPEGGDRTLAVLPLFHCFAMTVGMNYTVAMGGQLHLLPQFNLKQVLATIHRQRITLLPGVPTLFNAMLNAPILKPQWFESLRYGISGGAPLPPEVKEKFEKLTQSRLMEGYGLTEMSPVVCCNPRHKPSKTGSAGLPFPQTSIIIRNPEKLRAKPLKTGQVGEIWVTGPQLMQGYWHNPKATKECMVKEGKITWLRTGDLGFLDTEGYLHLTDRMKDIILVNGYNVYPRVIEDCLYTHSAVAEAMVIGLPDDKKGEVPHAYVVLKDGANVTAEELLSFARKHLNPLERPVAVVLRQHLPKTQVGKLSKKDLKAEILGK